MKKNLSFFKLFTLTVMMVWAFVMNANAANSIYVMDLSAQNSAFGTSNAYGAKTGTVDGVTWYINAASCQSASAVWLGTNNATNHTNLTHLDAGLNGRGEAIATALGVSASAVGYYAMAATNNISNVDYITVQAPATGGTAPTSLWCLYTTNNGATYSILDGVKPSPGTSLVTFTASSTIANAQYAFVWYSTAFGTYRTPRFEFFEDNNVPNIVISGLYGGGGNSGAPYKNDYIELYNTTNAAINLEGYTLYYASATGTSSGNYGTAFTFPAGATIGANKFALIKAAAGTSVQTEWPITFDFDASGPGDYMNLSGTNGKVLLLSTYHDLSASGSIPTTLAGIQALPDYVDYVPFGSATPFFGTAIPSLSNTTAAKRNYDDITKVISYTFNVGADFAVVTVNATTPRNSNYGSVVANPTISPNGGAFTEAKTVTITCTTPGASIYYTMDGTNPTPSSTLYTTPISLNTNGTYTIKAIGVKAEFTNSEIVTANFIINILNLSQCNIFEAFENSAWGGTGNGSYNNRTVTDDLGSWSVSAVSAMDANDRYYDMRSIRLRGNTTSTDTTNLNRLEMLFDNPNGIGTVSFHYASYSTHSGGTIHVQYSTDGGSTWTTAGSITNIPSWVAGGSQMLEASIEVNAPGNARIRITKPSQAGSTSVNIDNLCITGLMLTTYTVAVSANPTNGGTVTGGGTYIENTPATITATPSVAYNFINWTENGTQVTSNPQYTFTVTGNRTFVANFQ
ncbi:MAG: chitobiase/beta-hexosaminidase C-terminal domain-containing protein, partial [Bacteroidetes bacterium]|nr:chitobiase/beta-hexosaminidase C-terminal domain-containing protein [Bacteroidota bacterium]